MTAPEPDPLAQLATITPDMAAALDLKVSALLKGPSGTGKTRFALSFPGPIEVLYTDKNLQTLTTMQRLRGDINARFIESWEDFQETFVPAVKNRQLDCATVVVDTGDMLADTMWRELQGSRARLSVADFGTGLGRMSNAIDDLTSATRPRDGKRSYNVVLTSHLYDVTNDTGGLVRTTCRFMGAFKDLVEDYFDYVFLCATEVRSTVVEKQVDGVKRKLSERSKQFFVWTCPPSQYHTCKAPGEWPDRIEGYEQLAKLLEGGVK